VNAPSLDPMTLMAGFVINDDGVRWGDVAEPFQRDDAKAIFDRTPGAPRRHYLTRGRGMAKTADVSAALLVLMLTEAPPLSRSHVYAVDGDQAAITLDTIAGFVERNHLSGQIEIKANTVTVRATGATLTIETSDGASAFGLRPWLTVVDELSMWPNTANHRRLWGAIVSAVPKVPGSRLIAIGTGGSPASLGAEVWARAKASLHWHTSMNPGPAPWWTAEDIDATRSDLTAAEWRRLIACEWAEGDDSLSNAEDVAACIRAGDVTLAPNGTREYVAALDVGTRRDLTALAIGHAENRAAGRTVVIDRVVYWRPERGLGGRVNLSEVEATVERLCKEYRVERLRFDRMQAEQMVGNLTRAGVRVQEYVFSAAGAARIARSLHIALRDHAIELPDDEELRSEASTVRMLETAPGMVKMSNPTGTHDDVLTAVGMVTADLIEQPEIGFGQFSNPRAIYAARKPSAATGGRPAISGLMNPAYARAIRGPLGEIAAAERDQSEAQRRAGIGLIVPGSANDPGRVRRS
jgi:hypothetical protein